MNKLAYIEYHYKSLVIIMDNNMIPVLEHPRSARVLYMKENLNVKFPVLVLLRDKLQSFRPKMLKLKARQKGTFCIESKNLLSFDITNASEEDIKELCDDFEQILNSAYANSRTYSGSLANKKVTEHNFYVM